MQTADVTGEEEAHSSTTKLKSPARARFPSLFKHFLSHNPSPQLARLIMSEPVPKYIPGQYIVVFKPTTTKEQIREHIDHIEKTDGKIGHIYDEALHGFSATLKEQHLTNFQDHEHIEYIEPDQEISINPLAGGTAYF